MTKSIGLVINPIAGMGGPAGLKGTDGYPTLQLLKQMGAESTANERCVPALEQLARQPVKILTGAGEMGETACRRAGIIPAVIDRLLTSESSAHDTRRLAAAFLACSVDLILFGGGDGTARDIADVVGLRCPVVGIPTGSKMYSAVFATSAANAGRLASRFLHPGATLMAQREVEILDIDEAALRRGLPSTRLYGYVNAPVDAGLMQNAKARGGLSDDAELHQLCRNVARQMERDCLYIIGPGTTVGGVMNAAGLDGTLLGVDVVLNGLLLAKDVGEAQLLELLTHRPGRVIVGVLGGQGCLFGRGNQPISARVLRLIGRDRIEVIATASKLASLGAQGLFVDTGDAEVDRLLAGFMKVRTGPARTTVVRVRQ